MKISELLCEAHHSLFHTQEIGPWKVLIDSHFIVSLAHKGVRLEDASHILAYSCVLPDVWQTVPIGKGAYFQDANTWISLYIKRIGPNELRLETVLPPSEKPKPPMFRRLVPKSTYTIKPKDQKMISQMGAETKLRGRDAVSQEIENLLNTPMNREQRRRLEKRLRTKK